MDKKNCPSLTEAVEIVERLKKRYEECRYRKTDHLDDIEFALFSELQKILGEEDNVTAHIGGVTFGEEK